MNPFNHLSHPVTDQQTLLRVEKLSIGFRLDKQRVFSATNNVSFTIPADCTVALVGESGSGKSVSALAIMRLLPAESAVVSPQSRVIYQDENLLTAPAAKMRDLRGKEISMIFQEPMSSLNPVLKVGGQIVEALRAHVGLSTTQARSRAIELLADVGIPEPRRRVDSYPHQLSGGQQQRVMIAMAIACEPKLLIADEPTTSLDVTIQRQILDLIKSLQQRMRMSVLFITHDLALVGNIADHVVVMQGGEVKESGTLRQIFASAQHPYTQALLSCRPRFDRRPLRLPVIDDYLNPAARPETLSERARGTGQADVSLLEVNNLSKFFLVPDGAFRKKPFYAVKNASFRLARGKTLGLVGESGSGKSTLGLSLMRLHRASGEVLFDGVDLLKLSDRDFMPYKKRMQIIFQNPYASLNPRFSVGQILLEPMQLHSIGASDNERAQLAVELLRKVGLDEGAFAKYPHEFSGGQRQRIAIARCLALKPDVIVCDESVSALDVSIQAQVLNLLQDLQDELHLSYIFISHDLAVVKYMSDHVLVMRDGEIVESADSDEIYRAPKHPYTRQLLEAIPGGRA